MDVVTDWFTMRVSGECSGSQVKLLLLTDLYVRNCNITVNVLKFLLVFISFHEFSFKLTPFRNYLITLVKYCIVHTYLVRTIRKLKYVESKLNI